MDGHTNLPLRPAPSRGRLPTPTHRQRSRSPDAKREPLRERDVTLQPAAGSTLPSMTLAYRPKGQTSINKVDAWLNGSSGADQAGPNSSQAGAGRYEESDCESDADDVTIMTFRNVASAGVSGPLAYKSAMDYARKRPTAPYSMEAHLSHKAHLEAIATFWGHCPSKILAPALIPNESLIPAALTQTSYAKLEPMAWDHDLVRGLRLLAPLCTASEANFWLMTELRKTRDDASKGTDYMTKFTVYEVYKMFKAKGYKPKTLVQAQKENKARSEAQMLPKTSMPSSSMRASGPAAPVNPFRSQSHSQLSTSHQPSVTGSMYDPSRARGAFTPSNPHPSPFPYAPKTYYARPGRAARGPQPFNAISHGVAEPREEKEKPREHEENPREHKDKK